MDGKKMIEANLIRGILQNITFGSLLDKLAAEFGSKTALVDQAQTVSYEKLQEQAKRTAGIFIAEGIRKDDNVMVWMNNRVEFFYVCFGLFYIGARPILMLPSHRKKELSAIADFSTAAAIVTYGSELGFDYVRLSTEVKADCKTIQKVFAYQGDAADVNLNHYPLPAVAGGLAGEKPEASDIALFLLSGGTTGTPKLIPKRHAAYLYNARQAAARCKVSEHSVYLAALSTAHDYPLCCPGVFGTMLHGGKSVLAATASFDEVSEWVETECVTYTAIAPVVAEMWAEYMEWSGEPDLSSLEYFLIGAAKLDLELARKLETVFRIKIIQGYGLGEGITCFTAADDPAEVSWSCQGRPVSEYDEVKIVDESGNELGPQQAGELIQKGPYTFEGYYRADELNHQVFTADGFFCTGDKAMLTKEGNIKIIGRVKEQINRAGENITPSEIEQYLNGHQQIAGAAVIGLPDDALGEKICAVLIKEGEELSRKEICKYLIAEGLANFKLPDCICYTDRFPYVNIGKVDKKTLQKQIMES